MPSGVRNGGKKKPRPEFSQRNKAKEVLSKLTDNDLNNKEIVWAALTNAGLEKLPQQTMGHIRRELFQERGGHTSNGSSAGNGGNLLKQIAVVSKAAKTVGGLDQLDLISGILRKAKEL